MIERAVNNNVLEQHYYKEVKNKVIVIDDLEEKKEIDAYMKKHRRVPPENTTRETGYSSYIVDENAEINSSMLKKRKLKRNGTAYIVSRLEDAAALPISCLASTEHVIAMQNHVTDFESESKPSSKKKVMFQVLVQCNTDKMDIEAEKKRLLKTICKNDDEIKEKDINVTFDSEKNVFTVEMGTQVTDIQCVVRNLNNSKFYQIIDCDFNSVNLNEGICLVKRNASNPIHALANIINTKKVKGFLERDAGLTTGLRTSSYQDNNWTFNFFESTSDLKKKTGYNDNAYAIKIHKL